MSRLPIHRRIPLLRRPFYQRDLAIQQRDEAVRERDDAISERDAAIRQRNIAFEERGAAAAQSGAALTELASERARQADLQRAEAEGRLIVTDYAYRPVCRPLQDRPGGKQIAARFASEHERYAAILRAIAEHVPAFLPIPTDELQGGPFWRNSWFPPFDGVSIYGVLALFRPERYVEVGSGISTRFARKAIRDLNLATRIVSIDPMPRHAVDSACDEVIRKPMEDVSGGFWSSLTGRDILFLDNSHRSFPGSDVTVFFSEVLPSLPSGLVWGLHDICLPNDYPAGWGGRFYNEQYLLLTYLLGGAGRDDILLPVAWCTQEPQLHDVLDDLWRYTDLFRDAGTHGSCFWMRRR